MSLPFPVRVRGVLLAMLMVVGSASFAWSAIYVMIPGVPGDVKADGYDDGRWFEAKSGSYGADRDLPESTKGGTVDVDLGIGDLKPLGLVACVNSAMAALAQAAVSGQSLGDVEIHLVELKLNEKQEQFAEVFAIIKLSRAFVLSFETSSPEGELPWYKVELIYSDLEITNIYSDAELGGRPQEFSLKWKKATNSTQISILTRSDFPDEDMDGMSDEYEEENFGSKTGGDPKKDSDGDGESDLKEFIAKTNPKDSNSFFRVEIEGDEESPDAMKVVIRSEVGRIYQLYGSDSLGVFFLIGEAKGDGGLIEFVDPDPGMRRFYEIRIILAE